MHLIRVTVGYMGREGCCSPAPSRIRGATTLPMTFHIMNRPTELCLCTGLEAGWQLIYSRGKEKFSSRDKTSARCFETIGSLLEMPGGKKMPHFTKRLALLFRPQDLSQRSFMGYSTFCLEYKTSW